MTKIELGQFFTKHIILQETVFGFIKNEPRVILEPSSGRGDLIRYINEQDSSIDFHAYEIDDTIELLHGLSMSQFVIGDFLIQEIDERYKTIIGNPPYVKTKSGNIYIEFIKKCSKLLQPDGELIFIIPSDFFKLTSSVKLLNNMLSNGSFTHIFHPHNEHLFDGASIDVLVFRYQMTQGMEPVCLYNNEQKYIVNNNGMVTFCDDREKKVPLMDYFDIYVGMVSGKEEVFKCKKFGNIDVLNGKNKTESYIFLNSYPDKSEQINEYLLQHKSTLESRQIRKFNESNWYQWGAPRNISIMKQHVGESCIYMYNLTRKAEIAFIDKIQYFGGNLLLLKPKKELNLKKVVEYLNCDEFKTNFMYSKRFKIGHRQLANMQIPMRIVI